MCVIMKTILLAVTGTQGSGKTVFTEVAKEKYAIPTYRMGNVIIEECQKRGLEVNGKNMAKMSSILRFEGGDQAIAAKSLPAIKEFLEQKPKLILIDGIRSYSELAFFKEELGDIILVAVITTLKERKRRVEERKRIDNESKGDFEEREFRELKFGLGDVITKADYFILNEGINLDEFKKEIEKLLTMIIKSK